MTPRRFLRRRHTPDSVGKRSLLDAAERTDVEEASTAAEAEGDERVSEAALEAEGLLSPPEAVPIDATDPEAFERLVEGDAIPAEAAALHEEVLLDEALLDEGPQLDRELADPDEIEEAVDQQEARGETRP